MSHRRVYEVVITGRVGSAIAASFAPLAMHCENGETTISGAGLDAAMLGGVLRTIEPMASSSSPFARTSSTTRDPSQRAGRATVAPTATEAVSTSVAAKSQLTSVKGSPIVPNWSEDDESA
jgi:hypothetical protein